MSSINLPLSFVLVGATLAACSSEEPGSAFPPANDEGPGGGAGSLVGAGNSDPGGATDFESCATGTATAEARPVYLVFMFDKSGSMVDGTSSKWTAATAASKAFFGSSESQGVHASLSFFPDQDDYSCGADTYATPTVAMTALPTTSFASSLDAQTPTGGTPTGVALEGAIAYAQSVAGNEAKGGKVAIVLVTDGLPDSVCAGSSITAVKDLAATVKDTLPTYVIGVGSELTSLKDIAVGGGTSDAFIVDTNDPAQMQQDFLKAITAIKASALACDYEIPAAPAGEQLDREKVNVVFKSGGGSDTIGYNPSCAGGTGWRYDEPNAPKRIVLCDASCNAMKGKPGQMEFLFGCTTRAGAVR